MTRKEIQEEKDQQMRETYFYTKGTLRLGTNQLTNRVEISFLILFFFRFYHFRCILINKQQIFEQNLFHYLYFLLSFIALFVVFIKYSIKRY